MRLKTGVVCLLLLSSLSALITLMYFLCAQDLETHDVSKASLIIVALSQQTNTSLVSKLKFEISAKLSRIQSQESLLPKARDLIHSLTVREEPSNESEWALASSWVTARHVIPEETTLLWQVMRALRESRVERADVSRRGTQLKLSLTLKGGQEVLFKPKRYSREAIVSGIYSGFDRHNGEIVAFHLSRLLGFRWAPIVVSRVLKLDSEVKSVATEALLSTFVEGKPCFYGQCFYCNQMDSVCAQSDGTVEGALILLLPHKYRLQKVRNPWQRTYRSETRAVWEKDEDFCSQVLRKVSLKPRILDIIDVSIFDFLIGNADRHHFEVFKDVPNSALLLIDNGKSFGDPFSHELTILFPLFQCCLIRNSTLERLNLLNSMKLSVGLETLLGEESIELLTRQHLESLDARLTQVLALIEYCFERKSSLKVIY